jgi:toxin ParE1/3/4
MKLRISKEAQEDLEEAWLHGAALWGERRADRFLDELREKSLLLTRFPQVGRPRNELSGNLRTLAVPPFVIFYRAVGEVVEVVRVLHGARDVEGIFESLE